MSTVRLLAAGMFFVSLGGLAAACGVDEPINDPAGLPPYIKQYPHRALCACAPSDQPRCHAQVRTLADGTIELFDRPEGFRPEDLVSAYDLTGFDTGGMGATVAIVDAMDNPNAEADLAVYRAQFGLPPCTSASGCFTKVNQNGEASPLPTYNESWAVKIAKSWAVEIALDLNMVSAICPNCKILLVEAKFSFHDLGIAVDRAAAMGATVISNSYGNTEAVNVVANDSLYYAHPGIAITVSTGDLGYGVQFPASSKDVIAVGGTTLYRDDGEPRGWSETAWELGGSGCSSWITKPQHQMDEGCPERTVADVSAVADTNPGVAVYHEGKWRTLGGTSAAAPIVAALLAVTGRGNIGASWFYDHPVVLYDVIRGSNGECDTPYLCNAGPGYDGPTGLGTPNGRLILDPSGLGSGGGSGSGGSSSSGGSCGVQGAGCDSDSDCCSDPCTLQGVCGCALHGGFCLADSECCSEPCAPGLHLCGCIPMNGSCLVDGDCCGGHCDSLDSMCNTCSTINCFADSDCCSGKCNSSFQCE